MKGKGDNIITINRTVERKCSLHAEQARNVDAVADIPTACVNVNKDAPAIGGLQQNWKAAIKDSTSDKNMLACDQD